MTDSNGNDSGNTSPASDVHDFGGPSEQAESARFSAQGAGGFTGRANRQAWAHGPQAAGPHGWPGVPYPPPYFGQPYPAAEVTMPVAMVPAVSISGMMMAMSQSLGYAMIDSVVASRELRSRSLDMVTTNSTTISDPSYFRRLGDYVMGRLENGDSLDLNVSVNCGPQ